MIGEEGSITLLMGNEAVARGAIEAGVNIAIGYPGAPSSGVISTLVLLAGEAGLRAEWAVNEKVAFDIATGASFTGLRCLVTMKSAGLNVASDSVISVAYGDVNGGLVIYVADDPGTHAGMEETDSRQYSCISLLPMIDVTDPQDAKNAIVAALDYSEEYSARAAWNPSHRERQLRHGRPADHSWLPRVEGVDTSGRRLPGKSPKGGGSHHSSQVEHG